MMQRTAMTVLTISLCFSLLHAEDEGRVKGTVGSAAVRETPVQDHSPGKNLQTKIFSENGLRPNTAGVLGHFTVTPRKRQNEARIVLRPQGQPKITLFRDPGTTMPYRKAPKDTVVVPGAHKRPPSVDPGCLVWVDPSVDLDIIIPVDKNVDPDMVIGPSPAPEPHHLRLPHTYRSPTPDSLELQLRPWKPDTGK